MCQRTNELDQEPCTMEMKIIHEGSLERCFTAADNAKKEWKKRYFVFKHFPTSGSKWLQYYKDKNWRKQDPKGVVTLHPGYEVVKVFDSKRKFSFEVKTVEQVCRLSAHSEDELNQWILILERENIVKSFVVEPVLDDIMAKIGAVNTCHLFIADTEVRLVSAQDGYQLIAWPFTCLRRYMSSRGNFSLEAGRRAPSGEGRFTFITSQHDEIYKLLDSVIKARAGHPGQAPVAAPSPSRPGELLLHKTITREDSYDHLITSPGVAPSHAPHPNYDQNIIPSPSRKSDSKKSNDYASPYAHMKNRGAMASMIGTKEGDVVHNDGKLEGYDNLIHQAAETPTANKAVDGYDVLINPILPTRPAPPPPTSTDSHHPSENHNGRAEGLYNTIDTQSESMRSEQGGEDDYYNTFNHGVGSPPGGDRTTTYDSLDHRQSLITNKGRSSVTIPSGRLRQGSFDVDDDAYNVLTHVGTPVNSPVHKGVNLGGDDYSTLDRANTSPHPPRQSKSFPIPPPRVPSTASDRDSQAYDQSSISSVSSMGSFDVSSSFRESQLSMSPTPEEQDFYSSIDYGSVSSTKSATPKQVISKPSRKTKPQDTDENNQQTNRPQSMVSNLRASLIAEGLNVNKINAGKFGLRRSSAEAIEERDIYDQINEAAGQNEGGTQDKKPVRLTKLFRSPSAPVSPEDIYEDPDISSTQDNQSKSKIHGLKPAKPRKKK